MFGFKKSRRLELPDPANYEEGSILLEGQVYPPGTHPLNTPINLGGVSAQEALRAAEDMAKIVSVEDTIEENKIEDDPVNHPAHYTDGKIEVSDFIADKDFNFFRGNAVKYISRAGKKDPKREIEDLQKAVWYLQREIHRLGGYDMGERHPMEGLTIMVPNWAEQNEFLRVVEERFMDIYQEGLVAQDLVDNIVAEMKAEHLVWRKA